MKARISQQARDTRTAQSKAGALYIEFKEIKNKCERILRQNNLPLTELQQFRQLEQQFVLDLNLLPLDQITQRRNRVMQAIDQIMVIESDIKLKLVRRQVRNQEALPPALPPTVEVSVAEPLPTLRNREPSVKQEVCPKNNQPPVQVTREKRQKQAPPKVTHSTQIEREEAQSIQNQLTFDHLELLNVWGRYKPAQGQTCDDKLDRLGKIIGNLRINLKTITGKEKEATTKTNLALHPEYMNLLRQVEQLQMANEELRVQNLELTEENKNLRMGFQSSRVERHNGQTLSARNQRSQVLYECGNFKIVKISTKTLTRQNSEYSVDKAKSTQQKEFDLPSLIKYTHLLQERIVDSLPVRSLLKEHCNATSTSSTTIGLEKRGSESPGKTSTPPLSKGTPEVLSTHSEVNSMQNLTQINAKLSNIRQQRKKMFEDDELWGEIERLKI